MDCSEGCPTAAVMFGVPGVHVLAAERSSDGLLLTVETDQRVEGCRRCGALAVLHDRCEHLLHDAPFGHRRVRVRCASASGGVVGGPFSDPNASFLHVAEMLSGSVDADVDGTPLDHG